jgi:hypothetical protein
VGGLERVLNKTMEVYASMGVPHHFKVQLQFHTECSLDYNLRSQDLLVSEQANSVMHWNVVGAVHSRGRNRTCHYTDYGGGSNVLVQQIFIYWSEQVSILAH